MASYGQFCPVAKAAEVISERWTLLVIREFIAGSSRFSEIHKGVPTMSTSLLARRLKELESAGVIARHSDGGRKNVSYTLTESGQELRPVVELLGIWGQRWVASDVEQDELDPSLLMWDMRRGLNVDQMPDERTVVQFEFDDVEKLGMKRWWLVKDRGDVDLCLTDPGFEVDVEVRSNIRPMVDVWMGRLKLPSAMESGAIEVDGTPKMVREFPGWLKLNVFADHAVA
jgi:DNA-binding HxlR family transcriptional regulator